MRKIDKLKDGYAFLSNFYLHPVTMDGVVYNSTEVAYQAAKTLDLQQRDRVRRTPIFNEKHEITGYDEHTPGQAKRAGRRVTLRLDWHQVKLQIMEDLVRQKFQYHTLKEQLLATGNDELVEGNTWGDMFWGKVNGIGENHLGRILMEIREEVRNEGK